MYELTMSAWGLPDVENGLHALVSLFLFLVETPVYTPTGDCVDDCSCKSTLHKQEVDSLCTITLLFICLQLR